jgi:hypothetical protein
MPCSASWISFRECSVPDAATLDPIAHIGEDILSAEVFMRFEAFSFGSIRIDGVSYEHDVVIDRGRIRKREKKPSKPFHAAYGHTPLSVEEKIP